jgi:hypothetical protein
MLIKRISTFLDLYIELDLKADILDEARALGALGPAGTEAAHRPLPAHT